jgi:hypothetical protein
LHPDLVEGGVVDQKRSEAVKIDPSLGDVVHGGDRALQFHREGMDTKKLRLNVNEQQVAHLNSKGSGLRLNCRKDKHASRRNLQKYAGNEREADAPEAGQPERESNGAPRRT